jgi:hypothetical protein
MNVTIEWEEEEDQFPGRAWPANRRPETLLAVNGLVVCLYALRVHDSGPCDEQVAHGADFAEEVDAIQTAGGGRLATVELPGLEGDWIIVAHPFGN